MGPALQRLLSRPSSLELLRNLIGRPTRTSTRKGSCTPKRRKHGSTATAVRHHHETSIHNFRNKQQQNSTDNEEHLVKDKETQVPCVNIWDPEQLLKAADYYIADEQLSDQVEPFFHFATNLENSKEGSRVQEPTTLEDGQRIITSLQEMGSCKKPNLHETCSCGGISETCSIPHLPKHSLVQDCDILPSKDSSSPSDVMISYTADPDRIRMLSQSRSFRSWDKYLCSHKMLDFESNLEALPSMLNTTRLVDRRLYQDDLGLWACLLTFRKRVYGSYGTLMFWNNIRKRQLHLPCSRPLGDLFWPTFLTLGFENHSLLRQVCDYADDLLDKYNERWSGLYVYIVEHFLCVGDGAAAIRWHRRLFNSHPPGPAQFAAMFRQIILGQGDMKALKTIYKQTGYKNAYAIVIPALCAREEYNLAIEWHYTFIKHGDLPSAAKLVEPLVHFLAVYYPHQAATLTKSLVDAGASFAPTLTSKLEHHTKISREIMNLVHGRDLNIQPKKYNDSLGARWFATTWVSLDTAISTIHALGVQEIGPLSLQAIALRDPDPESVTLRIKQLRDLGISTGSSLFSRAVEHFASVGNQKTDSLYGLLRNDQHPDELENADLQEALLATYAQAKDWVRYRRTLEIRALASRSPRIETANIILRSIITRRNISAILDQLEDMQLQGVPVKASSIKHLLSHIMYQRRPGRQPNMPKSQNIRGVSNDLDTAIRVLLKIMTTGSFVPVTQWREIIRRLGMRGNFQELYNLCTYLAHWYGHQTSRRKRYRIPMEVPTSHKLHPLNILFSPALQGAIVEWGFIASLQRKPCHQYITEHQQSFELISNPSSIPDVTGGIRLLKRLAEQGVYINGPTVRKAIFQRLIAYFGPGTSCKRQNRWGQRKLAGEMHQIAHQIDRALGGVYLTSPSINLAVKIKDMAIKRMQRTQRTRSKKVRSSQGNATADPRLLNSPRAGSRGGL